LTWSTGLKASTILSACIRRSISRYRIFWRRRWPLRKVVYVKSRQGHCLSDRPAAPTTLTY
jgi:hypothetical protein